ncbi:MAG: hypothetical protein A2050_17205 [Candidatus Rokubacteria bacterium GWA2_73_35]|nr:MAG: hypothetical protein A2050_17205 [Candidatus Rokubacteria bacterium GWA2_73_35]
MSATSGDDLLATAVAAHGGPARWREVREVTARLRSGGLALAARGRPRAFRAYEARILTAEPRVVIAPYPRPGLRGVFEARAVRIETEAGATLARREDPRAAFAGLRRALWWDPLDALHFAGYALWNYFTLPFLLLRDGFVLRELPAWEEAGERRRRLHVTFPPDVPTHSREQVLHFDAAGLLRRHDYTAEVFGGWAHAAHYATGHRAFAGLVVPTRRRVYPRRRDGRARPFPTLVWIDVDDVRLA